MNQAPMVVVQFASWLLQIEKGKEQQETALLGKTWVQLVTLRCRQVVGDGIYKLHRICIAQFLHSRSTLSHPVQ